MHQTVKAFVELIPRLASLHGWIQVIVNLICGWKEVKEAITILKAALNDGNAVKRYHGFGKFVGLFVKVTSS